MKYAYEHPRLARERDPVLTQLLARRGMGVYLAEHLGVTRSAVAQWYSIPEAHIPTISRLLDIPQYQLRGERAKRGRAA